MDEINLIQQAQRHHLEVRELGEEIDLEIGPGDDDPTFSGNPLICIPPRESSAEERDDRKRVMDSQPLSEDHQQAMSKAQPVRRKNKVVKRWREEWSQFTQVELRSLKSKFTSAKNQNGGKVTVADLPPLLAKLKGFTEAKEDRIRNILEEGNPDLSNAIEFEAFLRSYRFWTTTCCVTHHPLLQLQLFSWPNLYLYQQRDLGIQPQGTTHNMSHLNCVTVY